MSVRRFRVNHVAAMLGVCLVSLVFVTIPAGVSYGADQRRSDCLDPSPTLHGSPTLTVEEQRLGVPATPGGPPVAQQLLNRSGLNRYVSKFERALCSVRTLERARGLVNDAGAELWGAAVSRAQGRLQLGTLDRFDDRPLYWARLGMTRAVREWKPPFELTFTQRNALVYILDRASRGITSIDYPAGVKRVLVSGFDTFFLDEDIRHSNPSGASALQLDGLRLSTPGGDVVVQSVVFPVNWTDFDQGIVEEAFGPRLAPGPGRVSMIMTISQGGRGEMDIEKWAGDFRGASPDNNRVLQWGFISRAPRFPQPAEPPQFIGTTLPFQAMIAAGTGPWPVVLHPGICEWPAGTFPDPASIECLPDPTAGATANSGTGGDYLSNESMYRTNRVRIASGALDVPGGHLHISSLVYPANHALLTDPAFESDRRATVQQTVALVRAAAGTVIS
jgi:hypothetical protein